MSSKKRILIIGHALIVDLNRSVFAEVAKSKEFEITIACPQFMRADLRTMEAEECSSQDLELVKLPAGLTFKPHILFYRKLGSVIKKGTFDVIHIWEEPYVFAGYQIARAARAANIPYFFKTDQNLVKKYPPPFSYFESWSFRHAVAWVGCGKKVMKTWIEKGYSSESGTMIPYAVDNNEFRPEKRAPSPEIDSLGTGPVIGFNGRLTEEKGWPLILEVLPALADLDWKFLVLGRGPMQQAIEARLRELDLHNRFLFKLVDHGAMPDWVSRMDLLIAPSQSRPFWEEQFGRMIIEAFASGVPVVASNSGEIPYVVEDAGLVLPETDTAAWIDGLRDLITNEERRNQLGQLGLKRCQENFASNVVAEAYARLYRQLSSRRPELNHPELTSS